MEQWGNGINREQALDKRLLKVNPSKIRIKLKTKGSRPWKAAF
jgi:hypothetical protein